MITNNKRIFLISLISLICVSSLWAQREYKIHNRGMLHESVFNNGILGQPLHAKGIEESAQPMMEWPSHSATIVNSIRYDGQHNSLGGGFWLVANLPGKLGFDHKMFSFCGLVGSSSPEQSVGVWTFPIQFYETQNYPVLDDGTLNPDYNPSEGEQIITAKWATSIGITITRVTRQWSYPDIDDLIIHEYEFEFTGDTDGDEATIEMESVNTLVDVTMTFGLNVAPSMYGYQRHYNQWKWKPGIFRGDNWASFDPDYWLLFNMDCFTNDDAGLAGKPEPIPELFKEFAETGKNGGGLASPQAVGYTVLYIDRENLTVMSPTDSTVSEYWGNAQANPEQLDENFKIKQPWSMWKNQGLYDSRSLMSGDRAAVLTDKRGDGYWGTDDVAEGLIGSEWEGRAKFDMGKVDCAGRNFVIGPYTLSKGDNVELSLAQVAGYGSDEGKPVLGGGQKDEYWAVPPSRNMRVELEGQVMTEHYLDDYGYPDYINSDVITVQDVARKAWELYTGTTIAHDSTWADGELVCWPENNPKDGVYQFPIPPAAPAITVTNTDQANIRIRWNRNVEDFEYATEPGTVFNIYRAFFAVGPWKLVGTKEVGDVNANGIYEFEDTEPEFKVGDFGFYAVTFQSSTGLESGKTNFTQIQKNIGAVDKVSKVYVVPNPFVVKSGFSGANEDMIGFYGLPVECTIDILSYSGQLIETIEHDSPTFSHEFFQVTRNNQVMASGIYFFVVRTPDGTQTGGKFAIVK